jgi:hypothetical protein
MALLSAAPTQTSRHLNGIIEPSPFKSSPYVISSRRWTRFTPRTLRLARKVEMLRDTQARVVAWLGVGMGVINLVLLVYMAWR